MVTVHKHEVEPKDTQKPYECDGCKEEGIGIRYRCDRCDFDLHAVCMYCVCTTWTTMSIFGKETFNFSSKKPNESTRNCNVCGKGIQGYHYHCKEEGWNLHPLCAKLAMELSNDDIKFKLQDEISSECTLCNKRNLEDTSPRTRVWAIESECKEHHFHVHCATEMVHQGWKIKSLKKDMDNNCVAVQNLEPLLIQVNHRNKNGRRGKKIVRILKVVLKTIARILLVSLDPTSTVAGFLIDVFAD